MGQILLSLGMLLLWLGALGIWRFRSPYSRLQVSGVADIGGATLFLFGLIVRFGWEATGGILVALIFFLLFTTPLGTHAIAKSAFVRRLRD